MRALVLVILVTAASGAREVQPCSISPNPTATVFQPASGKAPGRRPWIVLFNVKNGPVRVASVAATCAAGKICRGTAIAVDRTGNYLRPKAALADGTRIQVTAGKNLIADVTVAKDPAAPLPAWDGIAFVAATDEKEGLCSPSGPQVKLAVKPTKASLDGAVLLVYLNKPDPKQPLAKLAHVIGLGGGGSEVALRNSLGSPAWLANKPARLWVALSDGEGNVGPAIELP